MSKDDRSGKIAKIFSIIENVRERVAVLETQRTDHRDEHNLMQRDLEFSRAELNRRLAEMNRFREQQTEERAGFVEKEWFERTHGILESRVQVQGQNLTDRIDIQSKALAERIAALELRNSQFEGREEPIGNFVKWGAGVIGALLVIFIGWMAGHFLGR